MGLFNTIIVMQPRDLDLVFALYEVRLSCNILNRMTTLGAPQSYAIGR